MLLADSRRRDSDAKRHSPPHAAAPPSAVWLAVAKAAKVVGLVTVQQLIQEFQFSVAGVLFWALAAASVTALVYRPHWSALLRHHWPQWIAAALLFWLRAWCAWESLKRVSVVRMLMLTEYAGIWAPTLWSGNAARGKYLTALKTRGALFLAGALILELANDFGFRAADAKGTQPLGWDWLFLAAAAAADVGYHRVRASLATLDDNLATPLGALSVTAPLACAMGVVPYFLFGHDSTVLEQHSLGHIAAWMLLIGLTILVGDAAGNHSFVTAPAPRSGSESAVQARMVYRGWLLAVGTAACLGALHAVPSIFELGGIALFYHAVYYLSLAAPRRARSAATEVGMLSRGASLSAPLLMAGIDAPGFTTQVAVLWRTYVGPVWQSKDSRAIFIFLNINLAYMVIQLLYGVWTNSLGLISDAIHMFFDCIALGVGLVAAVMAKWGASTQFAFGYHRIETLSGFGNGVFLIFISVFILIEGIERLVHPPEMNTDRLLIVAVFGFIVNMIGIFSFHHGHGHGHGHDHGHDHGHGHGHHHHHHDNANMHGVFLHILADALGSVGVIISTLLIYQFEWTGFDPLASLLIAVLIFISTLPLLSSSLDVLMNTCPSSVKGAMPHVVEQIHALGNVVRVDHRVWSNDGSSGNVHALARVVLAAPVADEQAVLDRVRGILAHEGLAKSTVELAFM
ncbi:putative zinc transporter msc2 [Allomyces javanicus]|nr:putative zinc transporter msc2 [Allomyces javanicus]